MGVVRLHSSTACTMEPTSSASGDASGTQGALPARENKFAAESVWPRYMTAGIDMFADGTQAGDAGLVPVAGRVKAR